jgi:hypothetical protein
MASESLTFQVAAETPLPGGEKMIRGSLLHANNYYTSGSACNLSNYFKAGGTVSVSIAASDGYIFKHDQGNASNGLVLAYQNVFNTTTVNGVN